MINSVSIWTIWGILLLVCGLLEEMFHYDDMHEIMFQNGLLEMFHNIHNFFFQNGLVEEMFH